jgi:hypothetical protein
LTPTTAARGSRNLVVYALIRMGNALRRQIERDRTRVRSHRIWSETYPLTCIDNGRVSRMPHLNVGRERRLLRLQGMGTPSANSDETPRGGPARHPAARCYSTLASPGLPVIPGRTSAASLPRSFCERARREIQPAHVQEVLQLGADVRGAGRGIVSVLAGLYVLAELADMTSTVVAAGSLEARPVLAGNQRVPLFTESLLLSLPTLRRDLLKKSYCAAVVA